jgi:hypothetical protein
MVLQALSCGSAAWSDSTASRKISTPAFFPALVDALLHRAPERVGECLHQDAIDRFISGVGD